MHDARLRLSPFVRPLLLVGEQALSNQNMCEGPERLAYLHGLVEYLRTLVREGVTEAELTRFRDQAPFGRLLVGIDAGAD